MLLKKFSTEILDHFISEIDKEGRIHKLKKDIVEPTVIHVSKYFNKYLMYFYLILILLVAFIFILISITIKCLSKLESILVVLKEQKYSET